METTQIFALVVLAIGSVHLTVNVASHLKKWRHKHMQPTVQQAAAAKRSPLRDDWYVFFYRSALTGTEPGHSTPVANKQKIAVLQPRTATRPAPRKVARL